MKTWTLGTIVGSKKWFNTKSRAWVRAMFPLWSTTMSYHFTITCICASVESSRCASIESSRCHTWTIFRITQLIIPKLITQKKFEYANHDTDNILKLIIKEVILYALEVVLYTIQVVFTL